MYRLVFIVFWCVLCLGGTDLRVLLFVIRFSARFVSVKFSPVSVQFSSVQCGLVRFSFGSVLVQDGSVPFQFDFISVLVQFGSVRFHVGLISVSARFRFGFGWVPLWLFRVLRGGRWKCTYIRSKVAAVRRDDMLWIEQKRGASPTVKSCIIRMGFAAVKDRYLLLAIESCEERVTCKGFRRKHRKTGARRPPVGMMRAWAS